MWESPYAQLPHWPPSKITLTPPPLAARSPVPAGTYTESLIINKNLTLAGADRSTTILFVLAGQRVLTISGVVTVRLQHLTIQGGAPTDGSGGGIIVQDSNVTIEDCLVKGNQGVYGGGLFQSGAASNIVVSNSRFENNKTTNHGGGLSLLTASLSLTGTDIVGNTAGGHGGGITRWREHFDHGRRI